MDVLNLYNLLTRSIEPIPVSALTASVSGSAIHEMPSALLIVYDILLHVIPALIAGLGAYFGVKYAVKDHANRIDLLITRQMWVIRKLIALGTQHNHNHPQEAINMNDFPEDPTRAQTI